MQRYDVKALQMRTLEDADRELRRSLVNKVASQKEHRRFHSRPDVFLCCVLMFSAQLSWNLHQVANEGKYLEGLYKL